MALVNGSILYATDMKKFLKNLLLENHWSEFGIFSQDCSLCDPLSKIVHETLICRKTQPPWGEAFCTVWTLEKFFKILL